MSYKKFEQEFEEVYQKLQDDLQNVVGLDQANIFIDALFANLVHYRAIFRNKNNILQKTFDGCM